MIDKKQLISHIWGNGGNSEPLIKFHEDSGHGWLQVPKKLINQLGIAHSISGCSYQKGDFVYLEEDCDMALFCKAIGWETQEDTKILWSELPRTYADHSPIRNYPHYVTPKLTPTPKANPVQTLLF